MDVLAGVRESRDLAKKAGLPVNIMSGGSTGTYNIDHETGLTELEVRHLCVHGHGILHRRRQGWRHEAV